MKLRDDLNDTLRKEGAEGARARMDGAWKFNGSGRQSEERRLILSSGEFVAGYKPLDYAIHGLVQKRRIYALAGRTGDGKTAIKLTLAHHLGEGVPLAGREVEKCRVLYLAGENPDDVQGRWIAMSDHFLIWSNMVETLNTPGMK
jgi:AAA domain